MTYDNSLLKKFNLSSKNAKTLGIEPAVSSMMADPAYLRQSSALIKEALQKGFDVLQLANGDIVTTGTKTVVYQYTWDTARGKLVKTRTADAGKKEKRSFIEEEEDEHEADGQEA